MVLTILAAFVGYVLPWGQISFWGATVIINLLRVLPSGKTLVIWLWGGFYISSFTCRFFYAIHYIVPFVILVIAGVHLFLLHFRGRSLPGGLSRFNGLMIKFRFLFTYKDIVNLILLWLMLIWALILPDWSADPVNFAISDPSNSPLHIQPEWYFLHLYAVLRSIPSKVGGLIGFGLALCLLLLLGVVQAYQTLSQFKFYSIVAWYFFSVNVVLLWLGIQPVEEPYVFIGQVTTSLYFLYILLVLLADFTNKSLF
jgi:quinol-cytochrome oxidoreductase complex cytochrome b subunit